MSPQSFQYLAAFLTTAAYLVLCLTVWQSAQVAWRRREPRHLDIVFVVVAPFVSALLSKAPTGALGGLRFALGLAILSAQPYFLLRLVQRFRDVPRIVGGVTMAVAACAAAFSFWFRGPLGTMPLAIATDTSAILALYPAIAFFRESRVTAGVSRMRLLFAAAATLMIAAALLVSTLPGFIRLGSQSAADSFGDYTGEVYLFLYRCMFVCYFLAFTPPRWLMSRWQRTEQARFLSETATRDPEDRGQRAPQDLDRAVRRSMNAAAVAVALRADASDDSLVVRATTDTMLTGIRVRPAAPALLGQAVERGTGVSGPTERCEPELAAPLRGMGASVLVAPIRTATKTWGVVAVAQRGSLFPDDDLRLLELFGRFSGTALDHAHLVVEARERERELANRRVHAVEAQMGLTLDSIKDYAMFVLDREGRVATWHVGAEQIFGYGAGEMTGQPAAPLFTMTSPELTTLIDQALRAGTVRREGSCRRKDGTKFTGATTLRPLEDTPGERPGLVIVTKDVTEQRELESRLRQSQKMEAIGQLAGGIAHDFNNLLVAILGNADYLANALKHEDERLQEVGEIQKAAERAAALTSQLLAFTRRRMIEPRAIDLTRLVADLLPMLRRMIGEHVEIVQEQRGERSTVMGDRSQVEQVILNLAVNARDAMPTGGRLTIHTEAIWLDAALAEGDLLPGPYVMLDVRDTGIGMDAATQSRIFEPFFTTKEFGGGTGLGLATVYGIIRQMGGAVRVQSELDRGTSFRCYFPETRDREIVARPPAPADTPRGTETVLLVEDDDAVSRFLAGTLRRHGYQVLVAAHPAAAVALARTHPDRIHLVITDIVLPGGTGLDLVQDLTQIRPGVPALYISGYADGVLSHQGTFPKASHFLQKPFTAADLLSRVRQVLSVS